jgi:hypothetical protein
MLYSTPPLRVARLLIELRSETPLYLPLEQRGNVLRGAFGRIFQRLVCEPDCPGSKTCHRKDDCAYARLFEPCWPEGASHGAESAPRGFLFRPPLGNNPDFGAGRPLRFELRLIGKAIASTEHFLRTFQLFAKHGLADRAFILHSVGTVDWEGTSHGLLVQDGHFTNLNPHVLGLEHLSEAPFSSTATLQFVTPTCLKFGKSELRVPTLEGLASRVYSRVRDICRLYEGHEWRLDLREIGSFASRSRMLDWDGRWVEWGRTSTRTGQAMPMGGFLGRVTYTGIPSELWTLLLIGQEIHAGSHTVWGHGWYRVEPSQSRGERSPEPLK